MRLYFHYCPATRTREDRLARPRPLARLLAAFAALLVWAPPALPADKAVPASKQQVELSFAPLVKKAAPAVVNIYTRKVVKQRRSIFTDDPFFQRFFGRGLFPEGPMRERIENALGSGVLVAPDGLIVTNHHVIDGADEITVVLTDRREFEAIVVADDERTDLTMLRIKPGGGPLPYLELKDSDELEVGDIVLAIGNPFGVGQTVTSGIVSATARTNVGITDFSFFIQTDAAINVGNSGGALVTMDGRLAGVNTAIFSRSGGSHGIGFAVPANMVGKMVMAAVEGGPVMRPWLGVAGQAVTSDIAGSVGLDRPLGVMVTRVHPTSPAAVAGVKVGDVVTRVNGREILDDSALQYRVATLNAGDAVDLTLWRGGQASETQVTLSRPPEEPARQITPLDGPHPLTGTTVGNLSPAFNEELNRDSFDTGVVLLEIANGSPARRFRLRPGDVIEGVNGRVVETVDHLLAMLANPSAGWVLNIRRGDKMFALRIRG